MEFSLRCTRGGREERHKTRVLFPKEVRDVSMTSVSLLCVGSGGADLVLRELCACWQSCRSQTRSLGLVPLDGGREMTESLLLRQTETREGAHGANKGA